MKPSPRCAWSEVDDLYRAYHDTEWGVPVRDDRHLFEMLNLEGAQAGLSWHIILRKRENYRAAFDGFDPERIARYGTRKVAALLGDAGIVRNRLKVAAVITNARAFLRLRDEGTSFSDVVWAVVGGSPRQNAWKKGSALPARTAESDALSRTLGGEGFKFVGSTICYAFMQAVGLVNDHVVSCPRYRSVAKLGA